MDIRFPTVKEGSTFHLGLLLLGKKRETALSAAFSKITPSLFTIKEGSTSHLGLLPSGKKRETALLGAQNRYALRLAGHQSPRHGCAGWDRLITTCFWSAPYFAGWDRLGIAVYSLQLIVYSLRLISWLFADNLQISCDFLGGFEEYV